MKVLVSPVSYEEAASILDTGVDIIDIKNIKEGSLGAQFPWNTRRVVDLIRPKGIKASATLGDLPYKPGTAALAACGAAWCGVTYLKAGLHGLNSYGQAYEMMSAVRQAAWMFSAHIDVVAAGYADYRRFNGVSPYDLVRAARDAKCDVVMVDTAFKDGSTLFDALSMDEIREFVVQAHDAGLQVALAGCLKFEHADRLRELQPEIVGVRGAVCDGKDRETQICPRKTVQFVELFHATANVLSTAV
jgi:(5-formylfuran-3-yl)methyl phosphate synthase